ncbi:MAG: peptidylprolyl isomerase [Nanoarchaeota archaeon]|nr:peptidylprolyl isomerase [Nanoarchaeota archaeon]
MAEIKEKDFVELEYTGKTKEDDFIFDTTDEKVAKDNNLFDEKTEYSPIVISVGQGQVIKGLDDALVGKEVAKQYTVDISAEDAYGKKDAKLIQLISTAKFKQQQIQPMPGLQVNIDGTMGLIKTVSGGRTLVDFNHPLAGKNLVYDIKVNKIVDDDKEKIQSILKVNLGIKDAEVKVEQKKATINLEQEMPKEVQEMINKKIKELLPGLEEITIGKLEKKGEDLNISKPATNGKGGESGNIH